MTSGVERVDVAPAHDGLLYSSDEQLLRFVVPFLRDGFARGEAAIVVASDGVRGMLEPALEDVGPVEFVRPPAVFRRTAAAVRAYQQLVERALARGAHRVRAISEVDFGNTGHGRAESVRFEAVANLALAGHRLWNVCLYDTRRVPPDLLSVGTHAHPYLVTDDHRHPNPDYVPPVELLRRHSQSDPHRIEGESPDLESWDLRAVGLNAFRTAVHGAASASSVLPQGQIDDFVEAISEVASNALVHGEGPVDVRAWVTHQRMVCTVTDRGTGFDDPLAGFLPVAMNGLRGHGSGLWLARNFSDSLDFFTTDNGFTARLACWSS